MKQVLEQYASSVIAVVVAIAIFAAIHSETFFQDKSITQMLGMILEYSVGEKNIIENDAFDEYMENISPTIVEKEVYLVVNQKVELSRCFEARSHEGDILPVCLHRIWDANGVEIKGDAIVDASSICISEAGVYWVQVYTVDKNQKKTSMISQLLVNER